MEFEIMSKFIYPTKALNNGDSKILTDEQVDQWKTNGFALVNGILPQDLIKSVIKDAARIVGNDPSINLSWDKRGLLEFPTTSPSINQLSLNHNLLTAISQLLGTKEFSMKQADLWKKVGAKACAEYGDYENVDQRIHMDFPNHTFVHPPLWNEPDAVEVIIYLSDCRECGGCTAVVPKMSDDDPAYKWPYKNMPGFGTLRWINDRQKAENYVSEQDAKMYNFRKALYEREKFVFFEPGTILFYRYDLWHRGTPMKEGKTRWIQNMAFCRDDAQWVGNWNRSATFSMYDCKGSYQGVVEKMIANLSVWQRSVIGFPKPGSKYWNEYTLEAVRERFEALGMDINPYKAALKSKL